MSAKKVAEVVRFDDLDDNWVQLGGLWTRCVFMGAKNDPNAAVGMAIRADRNVGDFVAGKRAFNTTTAMTVLSGTVMHDNRWMKTGDMYVSPPNEINGDLLFGPEGAILFFMFDKRSGIIPIFVDEQDQKNFDTLLRKDVEEVASGRVEKSVSILPPRDDYTRARAITFTTLDEIAKYRAETGTEW